MSARFKGRDLGPEWRAKISATKKGRRPSPAALAILRQAYARPERKAKIRATLTGRRLTAKHRANISAGLKTHYGNLTSAEHEKLSISMSARMRRRGTLEFLDRLGRISQLKSKHERAVARWLDAHDLAWDYEPDTLLLSDGHRYTPDFRLPGQIYIEVKPPACVRRWPSDNLDRVALAQENGYQILLVRAIEDLDLLLSAGLVERPPS